MPVKRAAECNFVILEAIERSLGLSINVRELWSHVESARIDSSNNLIFEGA